MTRPHLQFLLFVLCLCICSQALADGARDLFESSGEQVVQVLIIEAASDKKAAIGSGFHVGDAGYIATNFHVVAEAIHEPRRYRVEVLDAAGEQATASIEHFDVVHDLALVRVAGGAARKGLVIGESALTKGETLYALGNPFDLGQTIVPGTFNGLLETSFYQKLLFSGSLNPGMSGGPALDGQGRVVGVNVATSGNQISFLVPVQYLRALLDRRLGAEGLDAEGYQAEIGRQLLEDQEYKYALLLNLEWPTQTLGGARVGGDISDYFKCWGDTAEEDDLLYTLTESTCTSQDSIYISPRFQTGAIDYQYSWAASEALNDLRFSAFMTQAMGSMYTRNPATDKDVTNYQCRQAFVGDARSVEGKWRSVLCVRQYLAYPALYDVLYLGALVGRARQGLSSHFALSGVTEANALAFLDKFMGLQAWDS
jgi:hypothetical protein